MRRKLHSALTAFDTLCLNLTCVFSGKKAATVEGGELHILIKEAKNLMAMKSGETSDSFVKGLVRIC